MTPRGHFTLAGLALSSASLAATPEPVLPEIVVTARHVAEVADRIPLVVDVIGTDRLGPGGITGLQSLPQSAPGLSFESLWGGYSAAPVLRGQSQPSAMGDNVGVFVDGLYQSNRSAVDVMPLDLERIEIARGPQNTLLGRSTFSGAILYVPAEPTAEGRGHLQAELGSDGLAGLDAAWSQRLADSRWLARVALGNRRANGSFESEAGEHLDARNQLGVAVSLARESADGGYRPMQFSARFQQGRFSLPATTTLDGSDYNCGGRDSLSGLWSYFCGSVPLETRAEPTPGIPDSHAKSAQVTLKVERPMGPVRLDALMGYYDASVDALRDFDGSTEGMTLGVCSVGLNCQSSGLLPNVTRLTSPNVVSRLQQEASEGSIELRLGSQRPNGSGWMAGVAAWRTLLDDSGSFGVDREDLLPDERLTVLLAGTPYRAGPISPLNAAVVDDSRAQQVLQASSRSRREGIAVFGMADLALDTRSRLRLELRAERERQRVESLVAGFAPDPSDVPAQDFQVVTPRLSLDRRFDNRWYAFTSLARGARSGGINTLSGLDPDEQAFEPEYNWTTELGLRYAGTGLVSHWRTVLYYIDWSNTQITGVAATPGVNGLITRNTAGITTRGLEVQLALRLGPKLDAELAYSLAEPKFTAGSDDAGSRVFCGLAARPPASSFCAFGPPRTPTNGAVPLVPYIDGRYTARTPRQSGALTLRTSPIVRNRDSLAGSITLAMQQDGYERPINGAFYGARMLLGANLSWSRANWRVTAWGTNLTDDRYLRAASSRGGAFFPSISLPRPLDFLYGEGRRIGLTVSLELSAD